MTTIFQTEGGKILKTFHTRGSGSAFSNGDTVQLHGNWTVGYVTHMPLQRARIIHLIPNP